MRGTQHFPQQNENCILGDSNFKQIRLITYHVKVQVFSFDRNNFKKHVDSNTFPSRFDKYYLWRHAWDISVTNTRTTQQEKRTLARII